MTWMTSSTVLEFERHLRQTEEEAQCIRDNHVEIVQLAESRDTPGKTGCHGSKRKRQWDGVRRFGLQYCLQRCQWTRKESDAQDDGGLANEVGIHVTRGNRGCDRDSHGTQQAHMLIHASRKCRCSLSGCHLDEFCAIVERQQQSNPVGDPNGRLVLENAVCGPHGAIGCHTSVGQQRQTAHIALLHHLANGRQWGGAQQDRQGRGQVAADIDKLRESVCYLRSELRRGHQHGWLVIAEGEQYYKEQTARQLKNYDA